jgi:hypothetical protein
MASNTYVLETGSSFKGVALTSAVALSYDITSSPTSVTADGSRHVLDQFVDQIQANIRIECLDASLLSSASLYPGQSGILICKCKLRTVGSATSTVGTATFTEAVYVGSQIETPNDGVGRLVLNFVGASSDDTVAKLFAWSVV